MQEILEQIEADNRAIVTWQTFGHLAPKPQVTHKGTLIFAKGCYGDEVIISDEFTTISSSPWWYEDSHDFVNEECYKYGDGVILKFEGTYRKFKNGKYKFTGKTKVINIA